MKLRVEHTGHCTVMFWSNLRSHRFVKGTQRSEVPFQSGLLLLPGDIFLPLAHVQIVSLILCTNSHQTDNQCRKTPMSFPDVVHRVEGTLPLTVEMICFGIRKRLEHYKTIDAHIFHRQCLMSFGVTLTLIPTHCEEKTTRHNWSKCWKKEVSLVTHPAVFTWH